MWLVSAVVLAELVFAFLRWTTVHSRQQHEALVPPLQLTARRGGQPLDTLPPVSDDFGLNSAFHDPRVFEGDVILTGELSVEVLDVETGLPRAGFELILGACGFV